MVCDGSDKRRRGRGLQSQGRGGSRACGVWPHLFLFSVKAKGNVAAQHRPRQRGGAQDCARPPAPANAAPARPHVPFSSRADTQAMAPTPGRQAKPSAVPPPHTPPEAARRSRRGERHAATRGNVPNSAVSLAKAARCMDGRTDRQTPISSARGDGKHVRAQTCCAPALASPGRTDGQTEGRSGSPALAQSPQAGRSNAAPATEAVESPASPSAAPAATACGSAPAFLRQSPFSFSYGSGVWKTPAGGPGATAVPQGRMPAAP